MQVWVTVHDASLVRVTDGDSFVCGGNVKAIVPDSNSWTPRVRVIGVDAPERGEEGWEQAREHLVAWLQAGPFDLRCYGREKYGRLLADAERDGQSLSDYLIDSGTVRPMTPQQIRVMLVAE